MSNDNMLYLQIRNYLLDLIEENRNVPDYMLPSENQLALKFNASRIAAKHAYQTLEADHLIIRQRGRGTFIAKQEHAPEPPKSSSASNTVLVVLPNINSLFMCELVEGLRDEFEKKELDFTIFLTGNTPEKEIRLLQSAQEHCRGILLFPRAFAKYPSELLQLVLNRFPLVQIDRHLPGLDLSYVSCDHAGATYRAVQFLLQRGYKRIGFITHPSPHASSISERLSGFNRAVREFDPAYPEIYKLTAKSDTAQFEMLFTEYINRVHPEVVISSSVNFPSIIMRTLKKLGMDHDVDLMLYDNNFLMVREYMAYHPYIIDQQPREIGRAAAELLCRLMEEKIEPAHIFIPEKIYQI